MPFLIGCHTRVCVCVTVYTVIHTRVCVCVCMTVYTAPLVDALIKHG